MAKALNSLVVTPTPIIVLMALVGCASTPTPNEQLAQRAEREVADTMKDPTSVKFKGVVASAKANCIMGQLLAKNSMGAYTGYHKFAWVNGEIAIDMDRDESLGRTDYLHSLNNYIEVESKCLDNLPHGTGPDRESNIPDS